MSSWSRGCVFNLDRYAKWIYITWGLLALVGITGYFSGGKNGNLIFTSAITVIFVILGVSFFIYKLPEIRYGRERAWRMREEEVTREYETIKKQSDLWDSFTKEKRMNLCKDLGLPPKYSKLPLIRISTNHRKALIFALNGEERRRAQEYREKDKEPKDNQDTKEEGNLDKYYYRLYCEPTDSFEKVTINYRRLCQRLHPDKLPPHADEDTIKDSGLKFAIITDAYEKIAEAEKSKKS